MTRFRSRLPRWATTWLIIQAITLSAFVPRDCCEAHKDQHKRRTRPAAAADHAGHHQPSDASIEHAGHHSAPPESTEHCVILGSCKGPMSAALAVLSSPGAPPLNPFEVEPDVHSTPVASPAQEHVISLFRSPDSPPPRA